jgi:hypothetical protein
MNDPVDPRLLGAAEQDPILGRLLGMIFGGGPEPSARMSAAMGGRDPFQLPAVMVQGVPEIVDDLILRWRGRGTSNNVEDRRTPTGLSQYGAGKIGSMPERPLPPIFSDRFPEDGPDFLLQAAGGDDGTGILQYILRRMGVDSVDPPAGAVNPQPQLTAPTNRPTPASSGPGLSREEQAVLQKAPDEFGPAARQVVNSLDAMDGEARDRVSRLLAAARAAGHEVYINETRRPQERQEWLYQQGRSRPGPIVTWTLRSDHLDGRAADLRFGSDAGYRWLWANAGKFGLSTLGRRDPGHVAMRPPTRRQGSGGGPPMRKQRNP